jgi:hypothetical protein
MSRYFALVLALALGSLIVPTQAFAQLTPPAGSAGAGNSAISGVPFGPANPRVLADPSGIGNASSVPPLRTNSPAPPVSYGSVNPRARHNRSSARITSSHGVKTWRCARKLARSTISRASAELQNNLTVLLAWIGSIEDVTQRVAALEDDFAIDIQSLPFVLKARD